MTFSEFAPKAALVSVTAAVVIFCTGEQGTNTAGATAQRSPGGYAAATRTVTVEDNSFSRTSLTLRKNDKIKFDWGRPRNRHNVTSDSPPERFRSKTTSRDSYSFTHKFTRTGTYSLFCTLHPNEMRMKVKVKRG